MNNKRRVLLRDSIILLDKAYEYITCALEEEQDCLDNIPENLQESDRYEQMESVISNLESAIESIESAKDSVEESL